MITLRSSLGPASITRGAPPRHRGWSCYYSHWHLIKLNPVSRERQYGVYLYDACTGDRVVYPTAADPRFGPCNNNDNLHPSGLYSLCPVLAAHHVPAGLAPHECDALSAASTALDATLDPSTYDPHRDTRLTVTTSFTSDVAERLAEGTCLANLDWHDIAWSMRWSDGAVDTRPGSGQRGITDTHVLRADPGDGMDVRTADVTAIATLHLTGDAVDFDDAGSPVVVHRAADVQISNRKAATGMAPGAVDTPPQLAAAALAVGQRGDGTLPSPDPSQAPIVHAATIRGRLLELFPEVEVLRPGEERVAGAVVGQGHTELLSWTYLGGPTDAPAREATPPGATGAPGQAISVQWNHAERLDARRQPVDESVPIRLLCRTTYPDGHVEEQAVEGVITVAIYYLASRDEG